MNESDLATKHIIIDADTQQGVKDQFIRLWSLGTGNFYNVGAGKWIYVVGQLVEVK